MGRFAKFHRLVRVERCWKLWERYGDSIAALLGELNTDVLDGKWTIVTSADRGTCEEPQFPYINLADPNSWRLISVQFDWSGKILAITAQNGYKERGWAVDLPPEERPRLLQPEIFSKLFEAELIAKLAAAAIELTS